VQLRQEESKVIEEQESKDHKVDKCFFANICLKSRIDPTNFTPAAALKSLENLLLRLFGVCISSKRLKVRSGQLSVSYLNCK